MQKAILASMVLTLLLLLGACGESWSEKEHELTRSIEDAQGNLQEAEEKLEQAKGLLQQAYRTGDQGDCKRLSDEVFSLLEDVEFDIYSASERLNEGYFF